MARTAISVQTLTGGTTLAAVVTTASVDQANGNYFINDGETLLKITNGSGSPITATITSVADPGTSRTGDITAVSIAAGATRYFGYFKTSLWNQTSGTYAGGVLVDYSSGTTVTCAAIRHA